MQELSNHILRNSVPHLIGLLGGFVFGLLTNVILDRITKTFEVEAKDLLDEQYRWVADRPPGKTGGKWLGLLEIILFYVSFIVKAPEIIAAWLVFKLGSKWEVWQNIIKVASKDGTPNGLPLKARQILGAKVFQRFLIGTLLNILWALIGVAIYEFFKIVFAN